MKAKKGKQLAEELIADLLGKKDGNDQKDQPKTNEKSNVVPLKDDSTVKISDTNIATTPTLSQQKVVYGGLHAGTEAALAQSEALRLAQQKILDLEKEMERLRQENESLAAAADTLRKRSDELLSESENQQANYQEAQESFKGEKEILEKALKTREREIHELKIKEEEYQRRLTTNIQKIRVRERELENRLELVKMESSALIRAKDEMILDLKRQLDQMNHELDNFRTKSQGLTKQLSDKQNMLRRTVRALRIALSMLEGERPTSDDDSSGQDKG